MKYAGKIYRRGINTKNRNWQWSDHSVAAASFFEDDRTKSGQILSQDLHICQAIVKKGRSPGMLGSHIDILKISVLKYPGKTGEKLKDEVRKCLHYAFALIKKKTSI